MTSAQSLYLHLSTAPGVQAIAANRVYPLAAPQLPINQDLAPTVVYRLAGRHDDLMLSGPCTIATTVWEIAAIASDYDAAHQLTEALITSLNYFKGPLGGSGGVYVEACTLQDATDTDAPELGFFIVILQFEIKYR